MKYFAVTVLLFVCMAFFGNAMPQAPGSDPCTSVSPQVICADEALVTKCDKADFCAAQSHVIGKLEPGPIIVGGPCLSSPESICQDPGLIKQCDKEDFCASQQFVIGKLEPALPAKGKDPCTVGPAAICKDPVLLEKCALSSEDCVSFFTTK